jgi:benzylsuccinate CoA-transferase BbsF subunit
LREVRRKEVVKQAFEGIKIAEFAWLAAGPFIIKYFSDHGATVIKIESSTRPDTLRQTPPFQENKPGINRSGWFAKYNTNKHGISLNLSHPKARPVVEKLVRWADIVIESFTPGVIEKWNLGYEEMVKINPDLIMMSTSAQGQTGPRAQQPSYGVQLTSLAGFVHLTNWPDRGPAMVYGAYTDFIAPYFGTAALVAALDYRRRTGKGQYIDLSQYECAVHFLAPLLLDYGVNERVHYRMGNRSPYAAPHGVYRCLGEDSWCAIAVFTDEEWETFCSVLSNPDWTKNEKFQTISARKKNEDELDQWIEEWTKKFSAEEVMKQMQGARVPAGVVQNNEGVYGDPQLNARGHFRKLEHPEMGFYAVESLPFKLSKTPSELKQAAPCLGQDNYNVYTEILGFTDQEFIELSEEGVFS